LGRCGQETEEAIFLFMPLDPSIQSFSVACHRKQ
jgi:hypothetical protein